MFIVNQPNRNVKLVNMQAGKPTRKTWAAESHRAAHQVIEHGCIFRDPLALRMLGMDAETIAREAAERV